MPRSWVSIGKALLPMLVIWLVFFVPTRSLTVATIGTVLIGLFVFPLALVGIYRRRMNKKYPLLQMMHAQKCPLCGEKIERTRFTQHLWLMPYTFKTLRHYETKHEDLRVDARDARWGSTVSIWAALLVFSGVAGWRNWYENVSRVSLPEAVGSFLIPFLALQLTAWILVRYALVTKKGSILGP